MLLSALAKPCRLFDPSEPLASQLLLTRHSQKWSDNVSGVHSYLYSVHRSHTILVPPSLAGAINLFLLRWLARDFDNAFRLCAACATDQPLELDEAQLWALLAGFEDDMEPETHALRLKLTLCTRTCQPHMACPWNPSAQLALYHAKLALIPAYCQLSAEDELALLRDYATSDIEMQSRMNFLENALAAERAADATLDASNPFATGASSAAAPTLSAVYPRGPKYQVCVTTSVTTSVTTM